jgi:hypothetical protein
VIAEVKYFLELGDVLSVQFECSACKVRSLFPIAKLSHMPYECPHCHMDWVHPQTAEEKAISMFLNGLRGATEALKGRGFRLSLEVSHDGLESPLGEKRPVPSTSSHRP